MTPCPDEQRWLEERFDRIDKDNTAIIGELADHRKDLSRVETIVTKHGVYWDLVKWGAVSGGTIAASIGAFFGWHAKP